MDTQSLTSRAASAAREPAWVQGSVGIMNAVRRAERSNGTVVEVPARLLVRVPGSSEGGAAAAGARSSARAPDVVSLSDGAKSELERLTKRAAEAPTTNAPETEAGASSAGSTTAANATSVPGRATGVDTPTTAEVLARTLPSLPGESPRPGSAQASRQPDEVGSATTTVAASRSTAAGPERERKVDEAATARGDAIVGSGRVARRAPDDAAIPNRPAPSDSTDPRRGPIQPAPIPGDVAARPRTGSAAAYAALSGAGDPATAPQAAASTGPAPAPSASRSNPEPAAERTSSITEAIGRIAAEGGVLSSIRTGAGDEPAPTSNRGRPETTREDEMRIDGPTGPAPARSSSSETAPFARRDRMDAAGVDAQADPARPSAAAPSAAAPFEAADAPDAQVRSAAPKPDAAVTAQQSAARSAQGATDAIAMRTLLAYAPPAEPPQRSISA